MKCLCCYKEFEEIDTIEMCPECRDKLRNGYYECFCECGQEYYKPFRAHKTYACPDCRDAIKKMKSAARQRKCRERKCHAMKKS